MEPILFPGEAGLLEGGLSKVEIAVATAVLCHPHPQYGGSMHDALLDAVSDGLLSSQLAVLRFNLRGVGLSEGSYDSGKGETRDLITAAQEARLRLPELPLLLGGYSFGGGLALRAAGQVKPAAMILVAPTTPDDLILPACPLLLISGSEDQWVDTGALEAEVSRRPNSRSHLLASDHFFAGHRQTVHDLVRDWLLEEVEWN